MTAALYYCPKCKDIVEHQSCGNTYVCAKGHKNRAADSQTAAPREEGRRPTKWAIPTDKERRRLINKKFKASTGYYGK